MASQRGWVAGKVHNFFGAELRELLSSFRAQSCSRRIQEYEVRSFFGFFQKLFRMLVVRYDCDASSFRISIKIPRGGKIGIHAHNSLKFLCKWKCEEPDSRIQIQRQRAMRIRRHGLQQILDQEAVYLKERKMADPVFVSPRFVR